MQRIQIALDEMAERLKIPCDIISIHRKDDSPGRKKEYQSLRYGAFLLTYGPFENFFENITGYRKKKGRTLPINPDRVRSAVSEEYGLGNITASWRARARVVGPTSWSRDPWILLEGQPLFSYLKDAASLRNLLTHGDDPKKMSNQSKAFPTTKNGPSIHLTSVEGLIQVAQDIASETAMAIAGKEIKIPDWPEPPRTTARKIIPRPYRHA